MGRTRRSLGRVAGMTLAVGVVAALVAGCSGGNEQATVAGGGGGVADHSEGMRAGDVAAGRASAPLATRQQDSGVGHVPTGQLTTLDRKLARSASMTVRTRDVADAAADARQIAATAGGYVGSERSDDEAATLTLTVPGEEMDAVLDDLEGLGKRVERRVTVEDVTEQIVDVDSRVASQRKSVERARELLDEAESIADLVTIERELAQREAELESLLARQDALRGRVAMAPITLTLVHVPAMQDDDGDDGFLGGLAAGWGAFTAMLGAGAEALGAALPFLVVAGVIAALVLLARRRRRQPGDVAAGAASGSGAASGTA